MDKPAKNTLIAFVGAWLCCLGWEMSCAAQNTTNAPALTNLMTLPPDGHFSGASNAPIAAVAGPPQKHPTRLDHGPKTVADYDRLFINITQRKWFELINSQDPQLSSVPGQFVFHFVLHKDGTLSDLKGPTNVSGVAVFQLGLCERALKECSPFPPFPPDMLNPVETDHRDMVFTFYYADNRRYIKSHKH